MNPSSFDRRSSTANVEIRVGARTDRGRIREWNEDNFVVVRLEDGMRDLTQLACHRVGERGTLLVVCDGMGGAAAGEVASALAIEALTASMVDRRSAPPPALGRDDDLVDCGRRLRRAAYEANARILRQARATPAQAGMGTTMTALQLYGDHAIIAQVGDSRAYVWRRGRFAQVTRDQSLIEQLIDAGFPIERARSLKLKNIILQAIGTQDGLDVQLSKVRLHSGDRLLLCSDGLVDMVSDEAIAAVVGAVDDPNDAACALVDLANDSGGRDNIAVILAHVSGGALAEAAVHEAVQFSPWPID